MNLSQLNQIINNIIEIAYCLLYGSSDSMYDYMRDIQQYVKYEHRGHRAILSQGAE